MMVVVRLIARHGDFGTGSRIFSHQINLSLRWSGVVQGQIEKILNMTFFITSFMQHAVYQNEGGTEQGVMWGDPGKGRK